MFSLSTNGFTSKAAGTVFKNKSSFQNYQKKGFQKDSLGRTDKTSLVRETSIETESTAVGSSY